ncbi:MAG: hypothetical protein J3R72DRAFT_491985 [Linnemannia gamsii]|nr:MAG: hypothetical protein J3R72DRAFT_491985 [Linnemannia gamsii]
MARQGDTIVTHRTPSTTTTTTTTAARHQFLPRQQQSYSTSTSTAVPSTAFSTAASSSSTSPTATRRYISSDQPRNQYNQHHQPHNDNTELDWKYLSTAETYTSEYSSAASDEYEEDGATTTTTNTGHNSAQVSDSSAGSRSRGVAFTVQRNNSGRPVGGSGTAAARSFLIPTTSTSSSSPTTAAAVFSTSVKEADNSTDTIKGMRARALDKVNGRKTSSNLSSSPNLPGSKDFNPYRRSVTASSGANAAGGGSGGGSGTASDTAASGGRIYSGQESTAAGGGIGTTSNKAKRRSFGLSASDKSLSLRITTNATAGNNNSNGNTTKTSQPPEANPSTPPTQLRKRSSGPVKTIQQPQQQQQGLFTSEDDSEVPGQTVYQDRTRYASEGGMLVSEIKALKARVQELEMERMNRSLSSVQVQVQSPQIMTPKSLDRSTSSFLPGSDSQQGQGQQLSASSVSSMSHSEKLQQIIQKHRGSSVSQDLVNPLRSPMNAAMSDTESARDSVLARSPGVGGGMLEPSLSITSPARSPLFNTSTSSNSRQPTTQHVDLLNVALKNYEKWTGSVTGTATITAAGASGNPSFQAISRVVTNAISMNQTIRAWVKADVSLVESSSMNALQRASDEQIRSLTEFLLAATRNSHPSVNGAADRSNNNNPTSDTESINRGGGGGSVINRPYSPRLSTVTHHRFGQGQRLSLGMAASEFGAGGFDPNNPPYPTRPLSRAAMEPYEVLNPGPGEGGGAATIAVGNGMTSSGYLSRTNSIASSSNFSEPRARSTGPNNVRHSQGGGGYASDYGYDRQQPSAAASQGLGLSRNQFHQQQHHQQQQQQAGGSGGGAYSSRESSPPQEDPRGPVPRHQTSGLLIMNSNSSRTLHSPQHPSLATTGSADGTGSNTPTGQGQQPQQHLTRRQASVRNIVARYSQSGAKSPNMSGYDQGELQDSAINQSQDGGVNGRPISTQFDDNGGPRSPLFHPRQVGQAIGGFVQDQQQQQSHQLQHQYRYRQRQEDVMSVSESSFGPGLLQANAQTQARMGASIRRPLSQQDHHRNMAGSRLSESGESRQGHAYASLGVRAGQRYVGAHGGAFSEDENANASDWGGNSQRRGDRANGGVVVVNPQRVSMDSYSTRLKQFRGRHEQQLPFHQEGLSFEEPRQEFAEGVMQVEAGDALATGPVPRFAQRQPRYLTQSQYLDKPTQHRQGFQQHHQQQQHHQDMMMSTPSLPSPNSSPSSSARLDAPSLMMSLSLSNHGQGGGLSAGMSSTSLSSSVGGGGGGGGSGGVDGRYHLSPRGPVGKATFPRQGVAGLGDEGSYQNQGQGQQSLVGSSAARRVPIGTAQ